MTLVDWRDVPAEHIRPLLLAERQRVLDALHWDLDSSLEAIEQARERGDLAGLLLHDKDGFPAGWTCYFLVNRTLHIGALHATTAGGIRQLLSSALTSPEAQLAGGVSCYLHAATPSTKSALSRLHFDLHAHQYLQAPLNAPWRAPEPCDRRQRMTRDHIPDLVRLLARAYDGHPTARAFAPNGRLEEFARYLSQLLDGHGAGTWQPSQSFVTTSEDGRLHGAVVTTAIARGIAHVAQLVVDPVVHRRGIGRQLLLSTAQAAASEGAERLTLVVAEDNIVARRLYQSLGFVPRGELLFGTRGAVPRTFGGVTMRAARGLKATA